MGFVLLDPGEVDDDEVVGATSTSATAAFPLGLLRLGYRPGWPCNVVLTEEAVRDYGRVFSFLLQLRKAVWALEQVHDNLKGRGGSRFSSIEGETPSYSKKEQCCNFRSMPVPPPNPPDEARDAQFRHLHPGLCDLAGG